MSNREEPKYGVKLYSRYTGEHCYLGSTFETRTEAEEHAKAQCQRCNRTEIIPVHPDYVWRGRTTGFAAPKAETETAYPMTKKEAAVYPEPKRKEKVALAKPVIKKKLTWHPTMS